MKQKFILSILAASFGVLSAAAQTDEKLIVNAGNTEHITVASDINVVLVQASNADGSISINPAFSDKIDLKLSKNKLSISSQKYSGKEKTTVYLHVNNLKTITVEHDTQVKTIGVIDSPKVDVYIDGESTGHLRTNGIVDAHSLNGAEVDVRYLSDKQLVKR